MNRKLPLAIALSLSVAASTPLMAIGVGEVEVHSPLSAPLSASLPLTDVAGVDPRQLSISLADEAAFERAGLNRALVARGIDFSIEREGAGLFLAMRSEQPVRDPFLELLLDIDWPDGRVLRQVTLLFDPPGYQDSPVLVAGASAGAAASRPTPTRSPSPTVTASSQVPAVVSGSRRTDPAIVTSGDTLGAVAARLRPGDDIPLDQMMLALVEANPEAFPSGNINELRVGVTLKIPSREAIIRRDPGDASALVQAHNQAWAARHSAGGAEAVASSALASSGNEPALDEVAQVAQMVDLLAGHDDTSVAGPGGDADAVGGNADRDERLRRVEAELLASQQALGNLESERDRLRQELAELRGELAVSREQLAQLSAVDEPGDDAGSGDMAPLAATHSTPPAASQPASWWGGLWPHLRAGSLSAAGVGLAILLALWVMVRRRRVRVPESGQDYVEGAAVTPSVDAQRYLQASITEAATEPRREEAPTASPMGQAVAIGEVDVLMTYGRYDEVRELLEATLEEHPERHDLRLKLLTVHAEQGAWDALEREAEALRGVEDTALQADLERLMARHQPLDGEAVAEASTLDSPAEQEQEQEQEQEPRPEPQLSAGGAETPRVIDYRPPTLEPSSPREETPMQPSVEFEPSEPALHEDALTALPIEEEWEVEEVAFEPLHLDNEQPVAASPEALLDAARRRLDQGQPQAARSLLDQALSGARGDDRLETEARRLIAQYDL